MKGGRHLRTGAQVALALLVAVEAWAADLTDTSAPSRRSSSWLTEVLTDELKYVPRLPTEDTEASIANEPAVVKDGVLNLPTMTIRPGMKESPSDYGLLTPQGRLELAMKAHPGLRVGNILGLNKGIAMFMQMEEQEVRAKSALYHRVNRILIDDSENSRETRRMLESALGRANAAWLKNAREK